MTYTRLAHPLKFLGWPPAGAHCILCNANLCEDTEHFASQCMTLLPFRNNYLRQLERELAGTGQVGVLLLQKCRLGGANFLSVVLGQWDQSMCSIADAAWASKDQVTLNACGRARWTMDKTAKDYLTAIWKFREAILGNLTVTNGKLHCTKSLNTSYELAMRQRKDATGASSKTYEAWRKWIPPPSWERNDVRATKKRAAYYVVFKSDCAGLFLNHRS